MTFEGYTIQSIMGVILLGGKQPRKKSVASRIKRLFGKITIGDILHSEKHPRDTYTLEQKYHHKKFSLKMFFRKNSPPGKLLIIKMLTMIIFIRKSIHCKKGERLY